MGVSDSCQTTCLMFKVKKHSASPAARPAVFLGAIIVIIMGIARRILLSAKIVIDVQNSLQVRF